MVQWIAYSLIADSACSLLISLTSQLQKTGATDGSRYLFLALAVWAKAAPIFGRFLFFGIVQLLVCSCIETTGCRWGVSYALRDKSVELTITIIMTIVFCYPQRDLKLWAGSSVHAVVRPCLPVEITMSTGWASQVALSCQEPPVVWGLKQPVAFWCPLDLVLLQSPSYSKFHPWHDVLPWSSLLLRLWHESCPQNAPPGQNLALPM